MEIAASLLTWLALLTLVSALAVRWIPQPSRTRVGSALLIIAISSAVFAIAILAVLGRLGQLISSHLGSYSNDWATAGAALAAFALAVWQYRRSVEQTVREFRWKQAEKAKELGDALLAGNAMEALNLIDYPKREYQIYPAGEKTSLTTDEALEALALTPDQLALPPSKLPPERISTAKAMYIRDCFDDLLNELDSIFALIEIKYVLWSDIAIVLRYYLRLLRDNKAALNVVAKYCQENGNWGAREIIGKDKDYPISP